MHTGRFLARGVLRPIFLGARGNRGQTVPLPAQLLAGFPCLGYNTGLPYRRCLPQQKLLRPCSTWPGPFPAAEAIPAERKTGRFPVSRAGGRFFAEPAHANRRLTRWRYNGMRRSGG